MDAQYVINDLKEALKPVKEKNQIVVSVEALEDYLKALEEDAQNSKKASDFNQQSSLVKFQAENDRKIKEYEVANNHAIEMFRSVITVGQSALKSSMIINGGGAMALLAFIGNIFQNDNVKSLDSSLALPVLIFCVGVLCSAMASGTTYLSQASYANDWLKIGKVFHVITIFIVIGSYLSFGVAGYKVFNIFGGI